jgi:hypothetical protein
MIGIKVRSTEAEMLNIRTHSSPAICVGLFIVGAAMSACSSAPAPVQPHAPAELWGDLKPVVSVKELMKHMIDPIADNVFESVKIVVDAKGTVVTEPRTDEDWEKVRVGGIMLVEGSELLKIPRPFAPPGDENNSTGPDAPELSPAQIKAKLERDPVLWIAKIQALRNVGLEVLEIVKEKNAKKLWDAGENLDKACENCHIEYWYPGDKALLEKLDSRLEQLWPHAKRTPLGTSPGSR